MFGKSWILTWKLNKLFYFLLMHNFNLETAKFFIFPRFVRSSLVLCSLLRRSRPAWSAVPQTVTTSCHWRPGTPTGFEDSCFNCFLIIESGIEPNEGKPIFFSSLISWVLLIFCDFFPQFSSFRICYSTHSSMNEIRDFVRYFNPKVHFFTLLKCRPLMLNKKVSIKK